MKLLILTQKVDENDPILGFFHGWIAEFAKHCESVIVICLQEGEHHLPQNAKVLSLGKENPRLYGLFQKFRYVLHFWKYIWQERKNYDAVFVHMNQEYVLLGGIFWKLLGKKITMWRNHYKGSIFTDIASFFCKKIFCTSRFSYTARYKKTKIMPVGVDQGLCKADESITRIPHSILFLGRLDESKRPDVLLGALGILARQNIPFTATFVGAPSQQDSEYAVRLHAQAEGLAIADHVAFIGALPSAEVFRYYRSHDIFVNCSKSGMFDKTIFEAMMCGCLVLAISRDLSDLVGREFIFEENDSTDLAKKIISFLELSFSERTRFVSALTDCAKQHSLPILIDRLVEEMKM